MKDEKHEGREKDGVKKATFQKKNWDYSFPEFLGERM